MLIARKDSNRYPRVAAPLAPARHDRLIELRKTLLAPTDKTEHRRIAVFTRGTMTLSGPAGIVETRELLSTRRSAYCLPSTSLPRGSRNSATGPMA
jgi:hypothetical protein